ncbi:MAG: Gx transporter family protein [Ruminococcaceae bacterium]|nr:Gx transporter family protein [Oscillospiraceae bacterium]
MKRTKNLTLTAILTALGIVLGITEAAFLNFNVLPGAKVGISNIVCLVVLYLFGYKSALFVNASRAIFVGFMYSGPSSVIYSLPAAIVSVSVMYVIKSSLKEKVSFVGVSVAGAFFHNLTQVVVAMVISGSINMIYYFSYLAFVSIMTGVFTGAIAYIVVKRIKRI